MTQRSPGTSAGVQFEEMVRAVHDELGLDEDEAEETLIAVTQALWDRIDSKEARDMLAQLPYRLKRDTVPSPPQPFGVDEFVRRVAEDLEVDEEEARRRIPAVFGVLRRAVTWGEFDDVLSELDPEYAAFLE